MARMTKSTVVSIIATCIAVNVILFVAMLIHHSPVAFLNAASALYCSYVLVRALRA